MSRSKNIAGTTVYIPVTRDPAPEWGDNLGDALDAVIDQGIFKSSSGIASLTNTEILQWRNGSNTADLQLKIRNDQLAFDSKTVILNDSAISSPSTNQTLTIQSKYRQIITPSADITLKLDNSYLAGGGQEIINRSTTKVISLIANDNSVICPIIPRSSVIVVSASGAPTANTNWVQLSAHGTDVSYIPTVTGFGSATGGARVRRVGCYLMIRGFIASGNSTTTEAQFTLPFGLTSSADIPTAELCGFGSYNSSTSDQFTVIIESSKTYLTFGHQGSGSSGLSKANGDDLLSTGQAVNFDAAVLIDQWKLN